MNRDFVRKGKAYSGPESSNTLTLQLQKTQTNGTK